MCSDVGAVLISVKKSDSPASFGQVRLKDFQGLGWRAPCGYIPVALTSCENCGLWSSIYNLSMWVLRNGLSKNSKRKKT